MGKEWLQYWVGGGGGGNGRSAARRRRVASGDMKEAAEATSAGCMCAVFQLFDLHQFQLPLNQHHSSSFHHHQSPFIQDEEEEEETSRSSTTKGVEAPRNSLEFEEPAAIKTTPLSTALKEKDESLIFPVGIQIKTSYDKTYSSSSPRISTTKSKADHQDFSSEWSSAHSPGTKTPTLVARLMGLDLLPESNTISPSFSSAISKSHPKSQRKDRNILLKGDFFDDDISIGARSLPETPRISSARRSDVEYHRLSLQIQKESTSEEFGGKSGRKIRRSRFKHESQNENRSPGHYARQIVKQVKESVSRRVGLTDITNRNKLERRDENLIIAPKPAKKKNVTNGELSFSPDGKQSITPSCSPRLRFLETSSKNKTVVTSSGPKSPRISDSAQGIVNPSKPKSQVTITPLQAHQKDGKCTSSSSAKNLRGPKACDRAVRNKKEEVFVHRSANKGGNLTEKKSKKTPLSSELLNISGPTLLPVKKDPSPPATKLPQKQSQVSDALSSKKSTQLSSNPSHSYKQLQLHPAKIFAVPDNVPPDNGNGCAASLSGGAAAEYENYIKRILKRTGITDGVTPLSLAKWHTPSHPLDPPIFHYLELFHPAAPGTAILSRRCNRKLIFQLVDELLSEILRPHFSFKPWASPIKEDTPLPLADVLCKKIQSFPAANCQVLEDIDALIETDFCNSKLSGWFEEEGERIVCEIEGEIIDGLVRETVAMVTVRTAEEQRQRLADVTWRAFT